MDRVNHNPNTHMTIYGIDFSGALDAGRKIWITLARLQAGGLEIKDCFAGKDLPESGIRRQDCLQALVNFIGNHRNSIFGLDFPFGLPRPILEKLGWDNWLHFMASFADKFHDPDDFRSQCKELAGNREFKRRTDRDSHAPFSPYNLRLFKQTYFGIKDILSPLVNNRLACVIPMQEIIGDRPLIMEVCPRSTLLREKIVARQYKGKTPEHAANRRYVLSQLRERHMVIPRRGLQRLIINDTGGDALDSVIAAYAVSQALLIPTFPFPPGWQWAYGLEGYIYH